MIEFITYILQPGKTYSQDTALMCATVHTKSK